MSCQDIVPTAGANPSALHPDTGPAPRRRTRFGDDPLRLARVLADHDEEDPRQGGSTSPAPAPLALWSWWNLGLLLITLVPRVIYLFAISNLPSPMRKTLATGCISRPRAFAASVRAVSSERSSRWLMSSTLLRDARKKNFNLTYTGPALITGKRRGPCSAVSAPPRR
jgi:hypothetical protein